MTSSGRNRLRDRELLDPDDPIHATSLTYNHTMDPSRRRGERATIWQAKIDTAQTREGWWRPPWCARELAVALRHQHACRLRVVTVHGELSPGCARDRAGAVAPKCADRGRRAPQDGR